MNKILMSATAVLFCFFVGFIGSQLQSEALVSWYPHLNKSSLTPPNIVFPVAWSFLYVCMGISIGLIVGSRNPEKSFFIKLFFLQLFLNLLWSVMFFYLQSPVLGFAVIMMLEVVILWYAAKAYLRHRVSSLLFFPYILWVAFAAYLNFYIVLNN